MSDQPGDAPSSSESVSQEERIKFALKEYESLRSEIAFKSQLLESLVTRTSALVGLVCVASLAEAAPGGLELPVGTLTRGIILIALFLFVAASARVYYTNVKRIFEKGQYIQKLERYFYASEAPSTLGWEKYVDSNERKADVANRNPVWNDERKTLWGALLGAPILALFAIVFGWV